MFGWCGSGCSVVAAFAFMLDMKALLVFCLSSAVAAAWALR